MCLALWRNSKGNSSASGLRPGSEPRGAQGRNGGRPAKMDARNISMAQTLMENPNASITNVCDTLRVSQATLYRHLEKAAGKLILTTAHLPQNQELHHPNARTAVRCTAGEQVIP